MRSLSAQRVLVRLPHLAGRGESEMSAFKMIKAYRGHLRKALDAAIALTCPRHQRHRHGARSSRPMAENYGPTQSAAGRYLPAPVAGGRPEGSVSVCLRRTFMAASRAFLRAHLPFTPRALRTRWWAQLTRVRPNDQGRTALCGCAVTTSCRQSPQLRARRYCSRAWARCVNLRPDDPARS